MAHRPVEKKGASEASVHLRYIKVCPVPSGSCERESSRAAGVLHRVGLPVLENRSMMLVVMDAERSVDGPVVRDSHILPQGIVIGACGEFRGIFPREFPSFFQQGFGSGLCRSPARHHP